MKHLLAFLVCFVATGAMAQGTGLPWGWDGEPNGAPAPSTSNCTDWCEYTQYPPSSMVVNNVSPIQGSYDILCTVAVGQRDCGKVRHWWGDALLNVPASGAGGPSHAACRTPTDNAACPGGTTNDIILKWKIKLGGDETAALYDTPGWKNIILEAFQNYNAGYAPPHGWASWHMLIGLEDLNGTLSGVIQTKTTPGGVKLTSVPNYRPFGRQIDSPVLQMNTVYTLEVRVKMNTVNAQNISNEDGILEIWVTEEGGPREQVTALYDVHYRAGTPPANGWNGPNGILWTPHQGSTTPGASAEFTIQWDDLTIRETGAVPPPEDDVASVLVTATRNPQPATGTNMEARCADLGANCTCSETLNTNQRTVVNETANPSNTTPSDKQCSGGPMWTKANALVPVTLSLGTLDNRPVNPPQWVWRDNQYSGGFLLNSPWTAGTKRRCTRYYARRAANTYCPTCCDGGKYWEQEFGAASSNYILGEQEAGQCFGSSGGLNTAYTCNKRGSPYLTCNTGGTLQPIDCAGEWCVHEVCLSGDFSLSSSTITLEGYHRRVRDNKIRTFSLVSSGVPILNQAGSILRMGNLTRQFAWAQCPNCTSPTNVFRDISHAMQAEWSSAALGQFIGPASELEGCRTGASSGCPPAGAGSGGGEETSNEPTGFTVVTDHSFTTKNPPGWYPGASSNYQIATDATAPKSPDKVGRMTYPLGMAGGSAPDSTQFEGITGSRKQLYGEFYFKISANWQCHPTGAQKIGLVTVNAAAGWRPMNIIQILCSGNDKIVRWSLQNTEADGGARNLAPNVGTGIFTAGAWHRLEYLLKMNTPGVKNGAVTWWLDGDKVGEYTNVGFVSGGLATFAGVNFFPIWGGVGGSISTSNMTIEMDNYYVSGKSTIP